MATFTVSPAAMQESGSVGVGVGSCDVVAQSHSGTYHPGRQYVIRHNSRFRKIWNIVVALLLIYTATILPYRLCFVEFAIPNTIEASTGWVITQWTVDGLFWLDLVVGFMFTYHDEKGHEVLDPRLIVRRYVKGYFVLNLIACMPSESIAPLVNLVVGIFKSKAEDHSVHKSVRLIRLQRISRLARLMRLARLGKLIGFILENPVWHQVQSIRGVRVLNLVFGLLWAVHLVACGWYLVASLHSDWTQTWVARRYIDAEGTISLTERGSFLCWAHSMYFVLTVFTTVGFGDMSALTIGEIFYACFTMLIGAVVNSIILSEVINIITSADQLARQVKEQKALIEDFSNHARLEPKLAAALGRWATSAHLAAHAFDRTRMRELLTGSVLPRSLTGRLPHALFDGQLIRNKFLTAWKGSKIPPRLPLLVALSVTVRLYSEQEVVYFCHDSTWSVFLVLQGIFVHLAKPLRSLSGPEDVTLLEVRAQPLADNHKHSAQSAMESFVMSEDLRDFNGNESFPILSPYQIFGRGNYFGEAEIFLSSNGSCGSRRSCVRCDCQEGTVLLLHKKDLRQLVAEFPRSADAWYHAAARRENHRQNLLQDLRPHLNVEVLAAYTIQKHVRDCLRRCRGRKSGGLGSTSSFMTATQRIRLVSYAQRQTLHEEIPQYAMRLQTEVSELRGNFNELRGDVANLQSKMDKMQGSLEAIATALTVSRPTYSGSYGQPKSRRPTFQVKEEL